MVLCALCLHHHRKLAIVNTFKVAAQEAKIRKNACWYMKVELTKSQRTQLNDALADHDISAEVMSVVLKDWDVPVSGQSIRKHRNGECSCPRS